jgi:hypothetical protein
VAEEFYRRNKIMFGPDNCISLARHLQDGVLISSSVVLLICELNELFDAPIYTSFACS